MPISATLSLRKLVDAINLVINFFKKKTDTAISTVDVNGYLFYKYRGMLFVRRGITHTFFRKDLHLIKNYLEYIINYLASENAVTWTRTVFVMEILIELERENGQKSSLVIEINNEGVNDYSQLKIKPLESEENKQDELKGEEKVETHSPLPSEIEELDEIITKEDMDKIAPIDIYKVLTPREVDELIKRMKKLGVNCTITEEND